jgi:hypothetical protein
MTQNEHNLIAIVIGFVTYQMVFHLILKHHPVTQKNIQELLDIFKKYF